MKVVGITLLTVAITRCGGSVVSAPADGGSVVSAPADGGLPSSTSGDAAPDTSVSCPDNPTPGQACSFPAGVTCRGLLTCQGVLESGGNVDVQCMEGFWGAVSKDACTPPRCVVGGPCDATGICNVSGAGPCGSEEVLTCDGGTYVLQSYACTDEGAGCGTAGGGPGACTTSCTCTNGVEVCTSSGDCDAG